MKSNRLFVLFSIIILPLFVAGQRKPNYVGEWYQQNARGKAPVQPTVFTSAPSDFQRTKRYNLHANANQLNSILRTAPELLNLVVPYGGKTYTLNLARVEVTSSDFNLKTNGGAARYTKGVQYRGIVDNNPAYIASLSISSSDVSGFFSTDEGNFVITKEGLEFIVYNDHVLKAPSIILCQTPDTLSYQVPATSELISGVGCKTVKVYFECDYNLYQTKGSNVNSVADYVIAFFNQVATLYANENIAIEIQEMFVWNTPDPYISYTTTSDVLNAFRANRGTNYNGNLAHFLSTRSLGGGVSYVDVLCNKAYAYGVSQIYSYYNNFPTYSWTVEVVAHELGHGVASPHTHSCSWSIGALDNCYTPEGSCAPGPAPTNGGTVMSYCHLTSYGINFNNGFGYYPGNLMRSRVQNATCIASGATTAPSSLTTTNITSTAATLNWAAVSGATNYTVQYRPTTSSTWISAGSTGSTSMSLSNLAASTDYVWSVKSDCSDYSTNASFTTSGTTPTGCTSPGALTTTNISSTSATVNWGAVAGAAGYTVQYKPSSSTTWSSVNSATTSVNLSGLAASSSYDWQVKADCSPYSSPISFTTLATTPTGCSAPSQLTTSNISSGSATLNWGAVTGATSYTVQYKPSTSGTWSSANTTATSINLSGLSASTSYNWQVKADCSAYSSIITFTTSSAPTTTTCSKTTSMAESNITSNSATLSWAAVSGAQSYTIRLQESGSASYSTYTATATSINVKVRKNRTYSWMVETNCGGGITSGFTIARTFTVR